MKSKHYESTQGEGALPISTTPAASEPSISQSCQHVTARGHHCHMLSLDGSGLCPHHARQQFGPSPDLDGTASISEDTADELLANIKDFKSPAAVNRFLGNVVKQVVRRRVSRRDAITLAYLSQLILNSQSAMAREQSAKQESGPLVIDWTGLPGPAHERRPTPNAPPAASAPAGNRL
jgi:hypothetical protein